MAPVTYIDSSAVEALKDLYHGYKSQDIQIAIANPNREVLLNLSKAELVELIGKEWYFMRVHDAVQVCLQHVQSLEGSPKSTSEDRSIFSQRLISRQRGEGSSSVDVESKQKSHRFSIRATVVPEDMKLYRYAIAREDM